MLVMCPDVTRSGCSLQQLPDALLSKRLGKLGAVLEARGDHTTRGAIGRRLTEAQPLHRVWLSHDDPFAVHKHPLWIVGRRGIA
jgi:hypothetical protein